MSLIQFDPLQQLIDLLLSNGWEQNKGQEDDRFKKGTRDIIVSADHSGETVIWLKLFHNNVLLTDVSHKTTDPLVKYFITH